MLSARSLPKWKKRVSLHFVHFVTFRMKSAAGNWRLSSSEP